MLGRFHDYFRPRIVGALNGQEVKLVKFRGEFVWHHHELEDELFLVLHGPVPDGVPRPGRLAGGGGSPRRPPGRGASSGRRGGGPRPPLRAGLDPEHRHVRDERTVDVPEWLPIDPGKIRGDRPPRVEGGDPAGSPRIRRSRRGGSRTPPFGRSPGPVVVEVLLDDRPEPPSTSRPSSRPGRRPRRRSTLRPGPGGPGRSRPPGHPSGSGPSPCRWLDEVADRVDARLGQRGPPDPDVEVGHPQGQGLARSAAIPSGWSGSPSFRRLTIPVYPSDFKRARSGLGRLVADGDLGRDRPFKDPRSLLYCPEIGRGPPPGDRDDPRG